MKTRLSIDTHFKTYRAIIARTKNFISDDDFIVHRGDINNPGYKHEGGYSVQRHRCLWILKSTVSCGSPSHGSLSGPRVSTTADVLM